ncbi:MAG: ATP-dependent DNA helicase RecQ [Leptolyngbyaceae cyanobacterium RU_5_1]|nr:ATP-dependent DNA helicase RecQ [Leptolyngbyaceae cyanobacterium RU_5_1]
MNPNSSDAIATSTQSTIRAELQRIWGYPDFRPPQGEIVQCLLDQQDALIVMPTGAGKSICFQLPALLQTGLTVVVSPLVALMENQVQELRRRCLPAALLHSQVPTWERKRTLAAIAQQKLRLLYLSPETLLSSAVWQQLSQPDVKINGLILDEAHCLVQWGETFRPAYYRLGAVRSALLQNKPEGTRIAIAAFTATADPPTQQSIQRLLHLNNPRLFCLNPYRSNLSLEIQTVWTPRQRRQRLLKFIQASTGQTGLVYIRTRRDSETLAEWLTQQGFQAAAYHAGLSPDQRRRIEQAWLGDTIQFVVCTNAFGMGIDKSAVRWIVHFHTPLLLSEYVQEIGRAGRDGKPATALMLISERTGWLDPDDKQRRQFFEHQAHQQHRTAQALIRKLPMRGEVATVSRQFKDGAIALSLLHSNGRLEWLNPFEYVIKPEVTSAEFGRSNSHAVRQMNAYLTTKQCRWRFLLNAFGFASEAQTFRCGHCDNCRR